MTNLEHFLSLSTRKMADVVLALSADLCLYCPHMREHRCRENCSAGLAEWFALPYNSKSAVWRRRNYNAENQ